MKYFRFFVLLFIAGFFSVSCNNTKDQQTESGGESPGIVSLAPSITKQLKLLGAHEDIIGHTSFCPDENLKNSEIVGSATQVNIEKVVTLEPSKVLCSSLTKKKTVEKLRKLDINVTYFPVPKSYSDICEQFVKIGSEINKGDTAKQIIQREKENVKSLRAKVPETKNPDIFVEIGSDPLYAATSNSFMHDYIRFAQGKNIAAGLESGTISRENVIAEDPDVIFIVTMGSVAKEEKEVWQDYPNLDAAEEDNIFIIDPDKAASPTPVSFTTVLEKIIQLIYDMEK